MRAPRLPALHPRGKTRERPASRPPPALLPTAWAIPLEHFSRPRPEPESRSLARSKPADNVHPEHSSPRIPTGALFAQGRFHCASASNQRALAIRKNGGCSELPGREPCATPQEPCPTQPSSPARKLVEIASRTVHPIAPRSAAAIDLRLGGRYPQSSAPAAPSR